MRNHCCFNLVVALVGQSDGDLTFGGVDDAHELRAVVRAPHVNAAVGHLCEHVIVRRAQFEAADVGLGSAQGVGNATAAAPQPQRVTATTARPPSRARRGMVVSVRHTSSTMTLTPAGTWRVSMTTVSMNGSTTG